MPFLIVGSRAKAEQISSALYDLRRPAPNPDDVTQYWVGIIDHTDGRAALDVSDAKQSRIDPAAIPDAFIDLVKEHLTLQEQEAAKQVIRDARGSQVTLAQITPQRIKDRIKSDAEMAADGWF